MNHKNKIIENINALIKLVVVRYSEQKYSNPIEKVIIAFNDMKGSELYYETIDEILSKNNELRESISNHTVSNYFEKLLKTLIYENKPCTEEVLNSFYKQLLEMPYEEKTVFSEFYGRRFLGEEVIKIINYEIYNIKKHRKIISEKYQKFFHEKSETYLKELKTDYLIAITVKARDHIKAKEIASEKFKSFENIFNFVYASPISHNHIKISEPGFNHPKITFVVSNNAATTSFESEEFIMPILSDHYFINNQTFVYLLNLSNKEKGTELESRILNSIEWSSHGLKERNKSKSLVYFVFAIESLLQTQREGFIVPSIVSQISDNIGFILGNDYHSRMKLSEEFRKIYRKRSAIVHSGSKKISQSDVNEAHFIIRSVVFRLIEDPELILVSSSKELDSWCIKQKFS